MSLDKLCEEMSWTSPENIRTSFKNIAFKKPKYICIEGGGVLGVGYCGAIKVLEKHNLLSDVKGVIGTSAGGVIGLFMVMGFNA